MPLLRHRHCNFKPRIVTGRLKIASCQRPLQKPSRQPTASPADENRGGLILDPKRAPLLLRGPESVLTIMALGFLTTTAFLANAARRINREVSVRARRLMEARNLTSRLQTRLRDRSFLQSAVDATQATLETTTSLLDTQSERVRIAEARLSQLEAHNTDLRCAEDHRKRLAMELAVADAELQSGEQAYALEENDLADLRRSAEESRRKLAAYDEKHASAKAELRIAEEEAQRVLKAELKRISAMETEVNEKDKQIKKALDSNQRAGEDIDALEQQATQLSSNVTNSVMQIEEQRLAISELSKRIHSLKVDIERKRDVLQDMRHDPQQKSLQGVVASVSKQQSVLKQSLSKLDERSADLKDEHDQLMHELTVKEELLGSLRAKAFKIDYLKELEGDDSNDPFFNLTADKDTLPSQSELGTSNMQDHLQFSNSDSSDAILRDRVSEQTAVMGHPTEPKQTQSRGRPRKAHKDQEPNTDEEKAIKRRRGRPRKTKPTSEAETTDIAIDAAAPKRKRGRPKKDSVQRMP